jgi:hypothetical protein
MTNIVKPLYSLLILLFIGALCHSQVLLNTQLKLNTGGTIYDVGDIPSANCYIVVGDFDSINGIIAHNIAFIDKPSLNVNVAFTSSITDVDFPIYSVEIFKSTTLFPSASTDYIYIGGKFTQINNSAHSKLALLIASVTGNNPPSLTLNPWNPSIENGSANGIVKDLELLNDTLIFSGTFTDIGISDYRLDIGAFKVPTNNLIGNGNNGYLEIWNESPSFGFNSIKSINNNLYATYSDDRFGKLNPINSSWDNSVNYNSSNLIINDTYYDFDQLNDSLISLCFGWKFGYGIAAIKNTIFNLNNGSEYSLNTYVESYQTALHTIKYKNKLFYIHNGSNALSSYLKGINTDSLNLVPFGTQSFPLADTLSFILDDTIAGLMQEQIHDQLFILDNRLFVSNSNMTSINGETIIEGLAIYCLEPMDIDSFIDIDTTVCAGQDSILYTVSLAGYATDYKWKYSGTGMMIYQNSGTQPLDTLTPTSSHTTGDSIYVKFGSNFTPGVLTVSALSECGIPSKPISINITSNPLPQVYAGLDTTLNCVRDTVILIGSSTTPNVTYSWLDPNETFPILGAVDTITNNETYVFEVRDSIGCTNYDTVLVTMDTSAPVANPITDPDFITCAITSRVFTGTTINPASTDSIYWRLDTNYFSNPIIASQPAGVYNLIALNKINGCADSSQFITLNDSSTPPNIQVLGYPNIYTTIGSIETLTCTNDTLNLTTETSTPNTTINWTSADSVQFYGVQLEITNAGTYYIKAINTDNGCPAYKSIIIDIDTIKPLTSIIPMLSTELSCSLDSLTLIGGSPSSNTNSYWTGPNNFTAPNSANINTPGNYYINVSDINNGCTNIDSISIEYNPNILVSIGNDTVACNQENVLINSSYIGNNITGLSYSWNNGSTNSSTSFTAGSDSSIILELVGDNSCYGSDTIYLTTPPTPEVSISSFKPCGENNDGQIVVSPTSGWTPFTYSIDNGLNFQNSGVFNNLAYGNYSLLVQDSLGCNYNFSSSINENSNLPTPLFLVQTYNFSSDTVILVDVSSPPTDSSSWLFPSGIQVIDNNSLAPVIILPDTGSFDVTMSGYYGACNVDITKTVYAIDYDSTFATSSNANGIKTMQLYPNPNTGNFNIEIEFYKKQQAAITIQDISGNSYFFNQYGEVDTINEYISLSNVINGTYILKIVSEFDSRYITFIITQ